MIAYLIPDSQKKATPATRSVPRIQKAPENPDIGEVSPQNLVAETGMLYAYAIKRVRDHHHAEDLVQKCLVTAWDKRESFEGRSTLRTWLVGILRFKILDHFRVCRRTPTDQADELFESSSTGEPVSGFGFERKRGCPSEAICQSEILAAIIECMNRLPERLRLIFSMREIDELAVSEIASAAGITPESTAVMLTRARARMRIGLERFDVRP